jgi:SAM-dependent methyltransferase
MSSPSDPSARGQRPLNRLRAYIERAYRGRLHRDRRAKPDSTGTWERELPSELSFWKDYIDSGGLEWPDEYAERLNPDAPLREHLIADRLVRMPSGAVSIVDVGAGPLTTLGKTYPGKELSITAVDPLAVDYDRLLEAAGLTPPVRTLPCRGEDLLERFAPESFDIAYARNSLDHGGDPLRIIRNMVRLVRPGGLVVLRHYRTEAETEHYSGLHQWNFDLSDGDLVLWSRRRRHNLTRALGRQVELECRYEGGSDHADWVVCVMTKRVRRGRRL